MVSPHFSELHGVATPGVVAIGICPCLIFLVKAHETGLAASRRFAMLVRAQDCRAMRCNGHVLGCKEGG